MIIILYTVRPQHVMVINIYVELIKKYIILREAYLIILYMALQQLELHIAEGHVLANAIL
ncbi:hypothetical protein AN700_0223070 [Klebsiella michiganensis]|nr:hypothetical protein AN700_0223070 [Klebsiella michiganensis]